MPPSPLALFSLVHAVVSQDDSFEFAKGIEHMAKLYFRYGTVGSAKTLNLLAVAHNYRQQGKKVILIKPGLDTRFGEDAIKSRAGLEQQADLLVDANTVLDFEKFSGLSCVLIDEAQFISVSLVEQLRRLTIEMDIPVICYGLRTDFRMNGFPGSIRLLELAHSIEELKTICACGKKAVLNGRMINGKFVFEGSQVCIENMQDVVYQSLCPECYFRLREEYEKSGGKIKDN